MSSLDPSCLKTFWTGVVVDSNNEFVIYPNPATNLVKFRFNIDHLKDENIVIKIMDMYGRIVLFKKLNWYNGEDLCLDIGILSDGMYIVDVKCHSSGITFRPVVFTKIAY